MTDNTTYNMQIKPKHGTDSHLYAVCGKNISPNEDIRLVKNMATWPYFSLLAWHGTLLETYIVHISWT